MTEEGKKLQTRLLIHMHRDIDLDRQRNEMIKAKEDIENIFKRLGGNAPSEEDRKAIIDCELKAFTRKFYTLQPYAYNNVYCNECKTNCHPKCPCDLEDITSDAIVLEFCDIFTEVNKVYECQICHCQLKSHEYGTKCYAADTESWRRNLENKLKVKEAKLDKALKIVNHSIDGVTKDQEENIKLAISALKELISKDTGRADIIKDIELYLKKSKTTTVEQKQEFLKKLKATIKAQQ